MIGYAFLISLIAVSSGVAETSLEGGIAFVANPTTNFDLFRLSGGGNRLEQLTRSSLDERAPAISPDGERIAYSTSDGAIRLLNVASKVSQKLPLQPGTYGYPTWLPDGSALVCTSYRYKPPDEDADLVRYSFKDGKQSTLLTQTGPQDFPALSPTGDRLAYMSSLAALIPGFGSRVTQQLWVASLRTGAVKQLLSGINATSRPAWSPDGKWLAFSSDRSGSTEIWIVDGEDATAPTQLTSGPGDKTSPTWSPDGQEIAYVSATQGIGELTIISIKSRQSRKLNPFGTRKVSIRDPHWR